MEVVDREREVRDMEIESDGMEIGDSEREEGLERVKIIKDTFLRPVGIELDLVEAEVTMSPHSARSLEKKEVYEKENSELKVEESYGWDHWPVGQDIVKKRRISGRKSIDWRKLQES